MTGTRYKVGDLVMYQGDHREVSEVHLYESGSGHYYHLAGVEGRVVGSEIKLIKRAGSDR